MNFKARSKKLLTALSEMAFDQSGDPMTKAELVEKTLLAVYERGKADGLSLKSDAKPPCNPDGGFISPNQDEFFAFWNDMQKEADRRFGIDDNEPCVVVSLTDRSSNVYLHMLPVPISIENSYYHPFGKQNWNKGQHTPQEEETRKIAISENRLERLRMITGNVDVAHEFLRQFHLDIEFDLRHIIEAPERARQARIKHLEFVKSMWSNPEKWAKDRGYVYDATTTPVCIRDPKRPNRDASSKPNDYAELMKELKTLKTNEPEF